MKNFLLRALLFASICALPACGLFDEEKGSEDDGGDDMNPIEHISLEFQLDRYEAVVMPEEEISIGYTLKVHGLGDSDSSDGETLPPPSDAPASDNNEISIEDLKLQFSAISSDPELYNVELQTADETSGTILISAASKFAATQRCEVMLSVSSELGPTADIAVLLLPFEYELIGGNEGSYVAPVEGGTIEIQIGCNTKRLMPLTVTDDWVHYDIGECVVEDTGNGEFFIQRHTLHIDPHTQGTEPRQSTIEFYDQADMLCEELVVNQQVDFAADGREMILLVRAAPANAQTVYLPLDDVVACTVDWGDGTVEAFEQVFAYSNPILHTYAAPGEYHVTIRGQVKSITTSAIPADGALNTILEVEKWGNLGMEELRLSGLTALRRVAPDTDGAFARISVFDGSFMECTALTELPEGLFAHAESAVNFDFTFYRCTALRTLPDGLFEGSDVRYFDNTFNECTALETLPEGLFRGCGQVERFVRTFESCTSLTELPEGLFAPCPGVQKFQATFNDCTGLRSIPAGLFANNSEVTSFGGYTDHHGGAVREDMGLFSRCTRLTTLPEGLFANNTQVTDLSMAFLECSALQEIPAKLFAALPNLTDLERTFKDCAALSAIPAGLFDGNGRLQDVGWTFWGCSALRTVPVGIFDHNRMLSNMNYTFYNCTQLEGESPYTLIGERKYHLYERWENDIEFAKPSGEGCFTGCEKLNDFDTMPEEWR